MGEAIHQILQGLDALGLPRGARVGVACSGGRDSVVLAHAAADRTRAGSLTACILHVQHALRGTDSAKDEAFVRGLALDLGLPCRVLDAPVLSGSGLERRARDARYGALAEVARQELLAAVLVAHHRDDQEESVVMRVLRGAGPRGLRGIPERRPLPGAPCPVLRPLLPFPGRLIQAAAEELDASWREDTSNADLRFTRNRVRHHILPALDRTAPGTRDLIHRIRDAAGRAHDALENAARLLRPGTLRFERHGLVAFDAVTLAVLPDALLFHLVAAELERPGRRGDLDRLLPLVRGTASAATLEGGIEVLRHDDLIWINMAPGERQEEERDLPPATKVLWSPLGMGFVRTMTASPWDGLSRVRADAFRAVVDADRVGTAFRIRAPASGDRIRPLGAPGTRRVADILSRSRVPRPLRARWPLVVDDEGILWIPGHVIAERGRVTPLSHRGWNLRADGTIPPYS
jgi:tRNA(Ile)-lysidine synthase